MYSYKFQFVEQTKNSFSHHLRRAQLYAPFRCIAFVHPHKQRSIQSVGCSFACYRIICSLRTPSSLFRGFARSHWSGHKRPSRPFVRVRKRFCKQNRAKIAAHVADFRFAVCRRRVTMTFFDSLRTSSCFGATAQRKYCG